MTMAVTYYTGDVVRALPGDGKRYQVAHAELCVTAAPRRLFDALRVCLRTEHVRRCSRRAGSLLAWLLIASPLAAQVSVAPSSVEPAAFERLALRVANPDASPVTHVRFGLPDVLTVLGVDAPSGWNWRLTAGTDTSATLVEWSGDSIPRGAFREFAVLVRLASDVRDVTLVMPVEVTHVDGHTVTWTRGGDSRPPTVAIRATTGLSVRGAVALAGGALGVAALALVLALHRRAG